MVRKFFIDFSYIVNMFVKVDKVICCFDSRSYRKDIDPNYKANRGMKKEKWFYDCLDEVEWFLKSNGVITLKHDGLEADDLIYLCTKLYDPSVIISNDKDLHQYLKKDIASLSLKKGNNRLFVTSDSIFDTNIFHKKDDFSKHLIIPENVTIEKILLGDVSDNIPRVVRKGVGPKALQKIIAKKEAFISDGLLDLEKMMAIANVLYKDSITFDKMQKSWDLVTFNGKFEDSIFLEAHYTYHRPFKMQQFLKGTRYLSLKDQL